MNFLKFSFFLFFLFLIGGLVLPVFPVSAKDMAKNCIEYCESMDTKTMPVGMACICPKGIQCLPGDPGYPDCPLEEDIIDRAANWIFYLGVIIAPLFILIGAFMFWTAGGDLTKASGAKKVIIYAVIGLALAMCTKLIYHLIRFLIGQ